MPPRGCVVEGCGSGATGPRGGGGGKRGVVSEAAVAGSGDIRRRSNMRSKRPTAAVVQLLVYQTCGLAAVARAAALKRTVWESPSLFRSGLGREVLVLGGEPRSCMGLEGEEPLGSWTGTRAAQPRRDHSKAQTSTFHCACCEGSRGGARLVMDSRGRRKQRLGRLGQGR